MPRTGLVVTLGDVLFLNQYPARNVAIEGHTDDIGSEEYNQDLSQRRADSVRNYLVRQGIGTQRLVATGMGEGQPVADNATVSGRQENRRVEVIIDNPAPAAAAAIGTNPRNTASQ